MPRIELLALILLVLFTGCSPADLRQSAVCEEVARLLFTGSRIDRLASATDASATHAIATAVTLRGADGGAVRHSVGCVFESTGPKSADQLALATVTTDVEGKLSEARLDALREALERKGVAWQVSWIPTFGPPHGELAPASPAVAVLYFLQLVVNGVTYGSVIALVAIGYTLIYGVIGVVNLAFGEIYMIGAFIATGAILALAAAGIGSFAVGLVLAIPITLAVTAGYSVATDRIVFRKLRRARSQMPLVASIGLSLVLQNYMFLTGGRGNILLTPPVARGVALAAADGFELYANGQQALLIGATLLLVATTWTAPPRPDRWNDQSEWAGSVKDNEGGDAQTKASDASRIPGSIFLPRPKEDHCPGCFRTTRG